MSTNDKKQCPIRSTIDILGGKWKQPIICMLASSGTLRYSSIKRRLNGITNMMLSQSLKDLEYYGIVHREQYNEVPPRVEYSLTEKGKSVVPIITESIKWVAENVTNNHDCKELCTKCNLTK